MASDLSAFAVQGALAAVAATGGPIWLALALAALSQAVTVSTARPRRPSVPQLAGEEDLAAANALDGLIQNVVVALGPALGALMLLLGPPQYAFAVNAASSRSPRSSSRACGRAAARST